MSKVVSITEDWASVPALFAHLMEEYPKARAAIAVIYDEDGTMHIYPVNCSDSDAALAAAILLNIAATS